MHQFFSQHCKKRKRWMHQIVNIFWQMVSCWFMLLMLYLTLLDICGGLLWISTSFCERLFWVFLRGLVLFFLKNNFSEIFIFAILLLCTLLDWVWYTIRLGSVHYSTGVWYTIQLESGTLRRSIWFAQLLKYGQTRVQIWGLKFYCLSCPVIIFNGTIA